MTTIKILMLMLVIPCAAIMVCAKKKSFYIPAMAIYFGLLLLALFMD